MTNQDVPLNPRSSIRSWRWGYAGVLVLVAAVYFRMWVPGETRRAFRYDPIWQYWGDVTRQATEGMSAPLWNASERMGYPQYADAQAAHFDVVTQVQVLLARVMGETPYWLTSLKQLLCWALLGMGMLQLTRSLGRSRTAAFSAAATVMLLSPIVRQVPTAMLWSFAWLPWLWWLLLLYWRNPSSMAAVRVGFVGGLLVLAGSHVACMYAAVSTVPFCVWSWRWERLHNPSNHCELTATRVFGHLAIAIALFACLVAAPVMATLQWLPETVRAAPNQQFWGSGFFDNVSVLAFVWPDAGERSYFLGLSTIALLGASVVFGLRQSVPASRCLWMSLWLWPLFAVWLALGTRGGLLPAVVSVLPSFGLFRHPDRYLLIAVLPLGLLVACGVEQLQRSRVAFLSVGVAALLCAENWAWRAYEVKTQGQLPPSLTRDNELASLVPSLQKDSARIFDRGYFGYRPASRLGVRDMGGYEDDPLALSRYANVRDLLRKEPTRIGRFGIALFAHDWQRVRFPAYSIDSAAQASDLQVVAQSTARTQQLRPLQLAPYAEFFHCFYRGQGARETLQEFARAELRMLWIEHAAAEKLATNLRCAGAARLQEPVVIATQRKGDTLEMTLEAPSPGFVAVNELFARGWHATVNGESTPIVPAFGFARAVAVPAGNAEIRMTFDDPLFRVLRWGVPFGWLVWLLLEFWWRARVKKHA